MKLHVVRSGIIGLMLVVPLGVVQGQTSATGPYGPDDAAVEPAAPTPTGQSQLFVIPFYTSQNAMAGVRSTALVSVFNANTASCTVGIQFQYAGGATNVCSLSLVIPAKQSRQFCSRSVNDPLAPCDAVCSPELTFNTGHAFVSATKNSIIPGCSLVAVDAQLMQTRDAADDYVESVSKLVVSKTVMKGD